MTDNIVFSDGNLNLTDKLLESLDDKVSPISSPKTGLSPQLTTKLVSVPKSAAGFKRGRMIWAAYPRKGKGDSIKFKSPALVGEGGAMAQQINARVEAKEKGAGLLGIGYDDVMVVQAGGFGAYYDAADMREVLP